MILLDSTIVAVATPALMTAFDADVTAVLWVTSAYLLRMPCPCSSPAASATASGRSGSI